MTSILIVSFGYLHCYQDRPPAADLTVDLRALLHNPQADPAFRHQTGLDPAVIATVMATPGAAGLIRHTTALAAELAATAAGQNRPAVSVAFGCAGGRHRSVVAANQTAAALLGGRHTVTVAHRDIYAPVVGG